MTEKERLRDQFIRTNKKRRPAFLKKRGFTTAKEYFDWLEGNLVEPTDVVIAFDTTGSMAKYRKKVREKAEEFVNHLFEHVPNLKMRIIAFGDYCDAESIRFQDSGTTNDKESLARFIRKSRDTGGGDGDEFYELVLKRIYEETPWRGGKQFVILIGDAPPHKVGYSYRPVIQNNQIDWRKELAKYDFPIYVVGCGAQYTTREEFQKVVARESGGLWFDFTEADEIPELLTGVIFSQTNTEQFEIAYAETIATGSESLKRSYKSLYKTIVK